MTAPDGLPPHDLAENNLAPVSDDLPRAMTDLVCPYAPGL
jgi:hypothetical protein